MFLYYAYAIPLSLRIARGFYDEGIWVDSGFVPYSQIGGLTWREGDDVTLVVIDRVGRFARRLVVPHRYYGEARRLLRDKIATHDIHFTGKSLDLGGARRPGRRVVARGCARTPAACCTGTPRAPLRAPRGAPCAPWSCFGRAARVIVLET